MRTSMLCIIFGTSGCKNTFSTWINQKLLYLCHFFRCENDVPFGKPTWHMKLPRLWLLPGRVGGKKELLNQIVASLSNPTQAGCFLPGWRRLHWAHRHGDEWGQEFGTFKFKNSVSYFQKRIGNIVGYGFSSLQFHTKSSTPQKFGLPHRPWQTGFETYDLPLIQHLFMGATFCFRWAPQKPENQTSVEKGGHWGHSYSNLIKLSLFDFHGKDVWIPNLGVFCCRCSYQNSEQLGMPGLPFGDWCLLRGWERCTLCWSHVAGPVSGGAGWCAQHPFY